MRLKNPPSGLQLLKRMKFNQALQGTQNGFNRFFTTPEKFIYDPLKGIEPVFKRNGQIIYIGLEIVEITESDGIGTGYDTIEFKRPPKTKDTLTADYIAFER